MQIPTEAEHPFRSEPNTDCEASRTPGGLTTAGRPAGASCHGPAAGTPLHTPQREEEGTMPAGRVSMRKTREILRLRWGLQRSLRDTAASCGVDATTVHDVVARARAVGLRWPLPSERDDAALEARLYPPPKGRDGRPLPDFTTL